MSALKQYGLMTGDTKSNFSADDLAKKISAAPPEELIPLYRRAALKPAIFRALFETYHGDTVSKAKLKQRAADLKVHPDETGNCVDLYSASMVTAQLVTIAGDQVAHLASAEASAPSVQLNDEVDCNASEAEALASDKSAASGKLDGVVAAPQEGTTMSTKGDGASAREIDGGTAPRAVFNVHVTLDASLDVEKLEKQLALLRRYGAL
ncbi:hypothetical protein [Roseateles chitosanitabidus]|uniref:hypothetical protein n=1 Tax=Roseateles chitosanitabidus TaxID=65048 RepID=UPI0011DFB9A9|nr:hypothetical protein [Roseateles chitosanitabidus]